MESKIKPKHELRLNSRNKCEMTGVTKVVDADARRLRLETSEGTLIVRGDELHIRAYSDADGTLEFEGRVDALEYAAARGGAPAGETERKLAQAVAGFLGKQMES